VPHGGRGRCLSGDWPGCERRPFEPLHCHANGAFDLLGSTIDDAAGEAFDKVAKILGLSYPGGPSIAKAAERGNRRAFNFPRPMLNDADSISVLALEDGRVVCDSGAAGSPHTDTSVVDQRLADIAASFQEAAVDVLVAKCRAALELHGLSTLCVGGGVAANTRLRERLSEMANETKRRLVLAPLEYCTDNAAMAAIAWSNSTARHGAARR